MTKTSLLPQEAKAAGIDFPNLCERIIELSRESRSQQKNKIDDIYKKVIFNDKKESGSL